MSSEPLDIGHTRPSYLAIDLGASSGRAVLGTLDGDCMRMREVHRFRTPLVEEGEHLYWDVGALWADIRLGLGEALRAEPALRSISVDSWAVDYVPLGTDGVALRRPYAYRDPRTKGRLATAIRLTGGAKALYHRTGIQFLELNTLPQIVADIEDEPALLARTTTRLMIAEYFLFLLSGEAVAERTMASTTQLLDVRTGEWSGALLRAIGDDPRRWPRIVAPGTVLGHVEPDALPAAAAHAPLVIATCAHDTAAAVAAVPASDERAWAYISSGTWSLVGVELRAPILSPLARDAGFTNEAGLDGTVRFLKNRTGMWVLEECCREWGGQGERPTYATLFADAAAAPPAQRTVDLNAPAFSERGGMVEKLRVAYRARGAALESGRGPLVRLILESLAESHAETLRELEGLLGVPIVDVHIVGGGARNDLLNQLTANACGRRVIAGPDEATVLGNLLVQARTLGDLPPGMTVRQVARGSAPITEYSPRYIASRRATTRASH